MTAPLVPDRWITPALLALTECLCETLNTAPYTPVCDCCLVHSQTLPPADRCDCGCTVEGRDGNGQAWVRLVQVSNRVDRSSPRHCASIMDAEVQLGVYRCIESVVGDDNELPSCDEMTNDAVLILADRAAMWRAVQCCEAIRGYDPQILNWTPVGPSGGCAGGVLNITLSFTP